MALVQKYLRNILGPLVGLFLLTSSGMQAVAQTPVIFTGTTPVGQTSETMSVTVTTKISGTSAGPMALTQGLANADYLMAAGGTCPTTTSSFVANQSCTVNVVFKPTVAGPRRGAVVLRGSDGTLLGSTELIGTGAGPVPALSPGTINTVAGQTDYIYQGDGVPATSAPIFLPSGIVIDGAGNFYISDTLNQRVRRVDAKTGLISTVAGTGSVGFSGDGGQGTSAMLSNPAGLAMDGVGALYIADSGNHAVRRLDLVTGILTTVAGELGQQGYLGDGGAATSAKLNTPEGVCFDLGGNMIISDTQNNAVRKVNASTGNISTIAGTGAAGYNGDNQQATTALLNTPWSTAVGQDGSLYVSDQENYRIRHISVAGVISTVAGNGSQSFSGDNGPAIQASLNEPSATFLDPAGDLFIADTGNNRIRMVGATTGTITTLSGNGDEQFAGDGGPANQAIMYGPNALFLDTAGDLYLTDTFHNRIREINVQAITLYYATIRVDQKSPAQLEELINEGNSNLDVSAFVLNNAALASTIPCPVGTPLVAAGVCNLQVEFAPTTIGNPVLGTVTVDSDAIATPVITLSGQVLSVNPTSVSVTSSVNPSLVSQSVTFTANVSSANSSLTGTVVFFDGTTQLCSVAIGAGNAATCGTSTLAVGQHSITASYSGDTQDASSVSPALIQVVKQSPSLVLTVSPNPAVVNNNVTLTFTASAAVGTPSGAVTFYDGTALLYSSTLVNGAASYQTSQLAVGTHALTVQYAGDASDAAGTSNSVSEVIQQATTLTSLASSSASASVGSPVTFTATVTSVNGVQGTVLTGTVQFKDGATSLGSIAVNNGSAALTVSTLTPGTHNIVAVYSGDTNDSGSQSGVLVETIQQIATTTQLSSSLNPANAGATVNFTATVSGATVAGGTLNGNVTFTDGALTLGVVAVNGSGQAVLSMNTLATGSHSIVATYAGNTNYSGSASSALVEVIQQTGTTTLLSTAATPTQVGTVATFTATVTSQTGIPTGSVSFLDNGVAIGSGTLNAQGVASFATSSLTVGTHPITALYVGNSSYTTSTSAVVQQVVVQATTTTALVSSVNPVTLGNAVTFTATVTTGSTIAPGGTVNFTDGANSLGSVTLAANGTASLTTSSLVFGPHSIVVTYSGDTNHAVSSSSVLTEQVVEATTAMLTSSLNPSVSGNSVVFTSKIIGVGTLIPTGSVIFRDASTVLATVTLDATGSATFQTSTLAVGSHPITATYSGDTNYSAASVQLIQTVQNANTQITLTSSANPATYGTPLTLTATVISTGGTATGAVTFVTGSVTLGTGVLNANGVATLTLSTLVPGTNLIVANYPGDGKASPSSSTPLSQVVKESTQSAVTSSADPAQTLTAIVLTATVTNSGVGVPSGTVNFTDGTTLLGSATLNGSGVGTLALAQLSAGSHSITVSYAGDGNNFSDVSSVLTQVVALRPTATTVSGQSTNPSDPQDVLLIGVVQWTGPLTPTGTITFMTGSLTIGTATVNSAGVATFPVVLSPGTDSITAIYSGDTAYAGSNSGQTSISGGVVTQLSMTLNPPTLTMQSKQHGTTTVGLTSLSGFSDTLNLGCVGLPFAATCTFSKTQVALAANGSDTVQLTVDTGDPLGAGSEASLMSSPSKTLLCFLPIGVLLGFGLRRRKKLLPLLLLFVTAVLTISTTGCGGLTVNGTPAGKYTFKVVAVGQVTGVTESQTMTLTVTP
jgi:sugar lactone lactonase YvrE